MRLGIIIDILFQYYDEDYSEEEDTRPKRRKGPAGGASRRNRYRYNSKRTRFNDRKDSVVKKERIPFLVPLMMVPENQVILVINFNVLVIATFTKLYLKFKFILT